MPFSNCSALPLTWNLTTPDVFSVIQDEPPTPEDITEGEPTPCRVLTLFAIKAGTTTVRVSYHHSGMTASIQVVAHDPLRVISHPESIIVVSLGSEATVTVRWRVVL